MGNHCIWIFGEANAGKTTTAYNLLQKQLRNYIVIDGDAFRRHKDNRNLTFRKQDILENNRRTLKMVQNLLDNGWDVIVAMITPYKDMRKEKKEILSDKVLRVMLIADEEVRASRINFTKSSIKFEADGEYELMYNTYEHSPEWIRDDILNKISKLGWVN